MLSLSGVPCFGEIVVLSLLDIFSYVSVLFRALTLAFEALTIGGIIFQLVVSRGVVNSSGTRTVRQFVTWSSIALALTQLAELFINSAVLEASSGLDWREIAGADYCIASYVIVLGAVVIAVLGRARKPDVIYAIPCLMVLCGSVMTTHSASRLDHRLAAVSLTLAHQLAAAAWIGGMPYLLIALRHSRETAPQIQIVSRFSRLAIVSVGVLLAGGFGMAFLYVGSAAASYGTTYGIMVLAKITLTGAVLGVGALNFRIVRAVRSGVPSDLLPLRRFAEVEAAIGFTIILAAAALTSAPPAIDVQADRVSKLEIGQRTQPRWPSLQTPSLNELSPPTPRFSAGGGGLLTYVPGSSAYRPPSPGDIAWSEYNHHWAGLIVLAVGVLALFAKRFSWARNWPILFIGLAVFLFLRADPENWPLGTSSFWGSFLVVEVAQHRAFVLLIIAFAVFEWGVQTGRISPMRAGLVFPLVCALGGALLMTHSHSVTNVKEEFLAELSHLPIAILAVIAGWSRWLDIRLPRVSTAVFGWTWRVCLIMIGMILLNYREA